MVWICDVIHKTETHTSVLRPSGLCLGLPRWAGTRKVKPIWILLKEETVSDSGISWAMCKSAPWPRVPESQTHNHASTPPLSFLKAGCPCCRPTNSVKALKVHQETCTKDLVKCSHAVFNICKWADRQTYHNTLHPPRGKVTIKKYHRITNTSGNVCSCSVRSQCRYWRDIIQSWPMRKSFWRQKNGSCDVRSRRSTRRCSLHTGNTSQHTGSTDIAQVVQVHIVRGAFSKFWDCSSY